MAVEDAVGRHGVSGRTETRKRMIKLYLVVGNNLFKKKDTHKYTKIKQCNGRIVDRAMMDYRLTITNLAINIPVPSVFQNEFLSAVSNFPGWCATVCLRFRHQTSIPFHLFAIIIKICCCISPSWIQQFRILKHKPFIQELLA